jgi:hypothetical protein
MSNYTPCRDIVPAIVLPDYLVGLEHCRVEVSGRELWLLFVHCHVRRWSAGVYKTLRQDFSALHSRIDAPLFALHTPGDEVHRKFLRAGAFRPTGEAWGDGREIYARMREV